MLFDKHITLFQCITLFSLPVITSGRLSPETAAKTREVNKHMNNKNNSKTSLKHWKNLELCADKLSYDACEVSLSSHVLHDSLFSTLLSIILIPKAIQLNKTKLNDIKRI